MDSGAKEGKTSLPSKATSLNASLVINIHRIGISTVSTRHPVLLDATLEWYRTHWSPGLAARSHGLHFLLFKVTPEEKQLFSHSRQSSRMAAEAR